jgi:hypothetical protein
MPFCQDRKILENYEKAYFMINHHNSKALRRRVRESCRIPLTKNVGDVYGKRKENDSLLIGRMCLSTFSIIKHINTARLDEIVIRREVLERNRTVEELERVVVLWTYVTF